eukprot:TRINITY_DN5367_c0_g1_i2.p1 TRINITY_DN5367_c0_g1~~TRINITY_DN5367_c0_g1_i2.p1  ORF type:complete len:117 (+),score=25.56 TRINITY_DN5367_c0_g1_i2:981-1331(+)
MGFETHTLDGRNENGEGAQKKNGFLEELSVPVCEFSNDGKNSGCVTPTNTKKSQISQFSSPGTDYLEFIPTRTEKNDDFVALLKKSTTYVHTTNGDVSEPDELDDFSKELEALLRC